MTIATTILHCGPSQYKQEVNIQWQQGGTVPSAAAKSPPNVSPLLSYSSSVSGLSVRHCEYKEQRDSQKCTETSQSKIKLK